MLMGCEGESMPPSTGTIPNTTRCWESQVSCAGDWNPHYLRQQLSLPGSALVGSWSQASPYGDASTTGRDLTYYTTALAPGQMN